MDEFYIGYLRKSPPEIARRNRVTVVILLLAAFLLALLLMLTQSPFAAASFEYGNERLFAGVVKATSLPIIELSDGSSAVLIGPGKHGLVLPQEVRAGTAIGFRGKLIQRQGSKLIEVESPIQVTANGPTQTSQPSTLTTAFGEVVDTKCFSGVMNPGSGKVHRGCAARCLHGGIPAALLTAEGDLYYLLDAAGEPLSPNWISLHAGEKLNVEGDLILISRTRILIMHTASMASD